MAELSEHVLELGPEVKIPGKVFAGAAAGTTGAEFSFQSFPAGAETGFLHTHRTHEELYIFLSGEGQMQVDGEIFPITEGSVVRVAPAPTVTVEEIVTAVPTSTPTPKSYGTVTDINDAYDEIYTFIKKKK